MSDLFDIYEDSLKIVIKNVQANIDKNNITENGKISNCRTRVQLPPLPRNRKVQQQPAHG